MTEHDTLHRKVQQCSQGAYLRDISEGRCSDLNSCGRHRPHTGAELAGVLEQLRALCCGAAEAGQLHADARACPGLAQRGRQHHAAHRRVQALRAGLPWLQPAAALLVIQCQPVAGSALVLRFCAELCRSASCLKRACAMAPFLTLSRPTGVGCIGSVILFCGRAALDGTFIQLCSLGTPSMTEI